ncbi:MAG TPA: hypothetical protein VFT76_05090 [Actinomycetota bacterium]|nr:hypothetical protein [Actinomycetota bacterium]
MAANQQPRDDAQYGWSESLSMSREDRLLTACAWCERVKVGDDWVSTQKAIRTLRTFDWPEPPLFTHGICHHCFRFVTGAQGNGSAAKAE